MKKFFDRELLKRVLSRFFIWTLLIIAVLYYLHIKINPKYMALIFLTLFILIVFISIRKTP